MSNFSGYRAKLLDDLRRLLVAYSRHVDRAPSTVCKDLLGDGKFAQRLEAGNDMRIGTYDGVLVSFANAWPADLAWPEGVPYPEWIRASA